MLSLFDRYLRYYKEQTVTELETLIDAVTDYDFSDYERFRASIIDFIDHNKIEPVNYHQCSTNRSKKYFLGPHKFQLFPLVEKRLRWHCTQGLNHVLNIATNLTLPPAKRAVKYVGDNYVNFVLDKVYDKRDLIWETINDLAEPTNIVAHPHILNELTHILSPHENILSLTNVDSPCFVRNSPLHVNDQMISWITGINFYTCKYRCKHILPLFVENGNYIYNLVNLHTIKVRDNDIVRVNKFEPCQCGRIKADFDFTPHARNFPQTRHSYWQLLSMADQLQTRLEYIQMYCKGDRVEVLYGGDLPPQDVRLIERYFERPVSLMPGQMKLIGRKLPCFWSDTRIPMR